MQLVSLLSTVLGTRRDPSSTYADMEAFVASLPSPALQERFSDTIRGRGAFRRFKDALAQCPQEHARWYTFSEHCRRTRVLEWLESEGVELTDAGS